PLELPHVQLPAPQYPEMNAPLALQRRIGATVVGVLVPEEVIQHLEHGIPLHRVRVRGDDGRELQDVGERAGRRVRRQLPQVGDEKLYTRIIEREAWHEI